jgi:hypothetical protein
MDFPQKVFLVFLNFPLSLLRNARKRHKKKVKNQSQKKGRHLPTPFSGYLPDIRRFQKNSRVPLGSACAWKLETQHPHAGRGGKRKNEAGERERTSCFFPPPRLGSEHVRASLDGF